MTGRPNLIERARGRPAAGRAEVDEELVRDRLVEAVPDRELRRRCSGVAFSPRSPCTGRPGMTRASDEHEEDDPEQDRDAEEQAADDEAGHPGGLPLDDGGRGPVVRADARRAPPVATPFAVVTGRGAYARRRRRRVQEPTEQAREVRERAVAADVERVLGIPLRRRSDRTTSFASSVAPSWNVTPSRRVQVQTVELVVRLADLGQGRARRPCQPIS